MLTKTIIYFRMGIGNLVLFTPAIQAIASLDESGKVDICLDSNWNDYRNPAIIDYLSNMQIVESIIKYPEERFTKNYKTWFYTLHAEHSEAFDIFKENGKRGTELEPDWLCFTHEIFYYMNVCRKYGYKGKIFNQYVPITELKDNCLPDNRIKIGIANGTFAGSMKLNKQWLYFKELVDVLKILYPNCFIIKLGFNNELSEVTNFDKDYVNKLSITETVGIINKLDLFIVNDTALMHVADALNVNTIAIFGGTLVSKNGPLSKKISIVKSGIICQPCQKTMMFDSCENPICLKELTVGDVISVVKKKLCTQN